MIAVCCHNCRKELRMTHYEEGFLIKAGWKQIEVRRWKKTAKYFPEIYDKKWHCPKCQKGMK